MYVEGRAEKKREKSGLLFYTVQTELGKIELCGFEDLNLEKTQITNPLIQRLKTVDETEGLTREVADYILNEANYKKKARKLIISEKKLDRYFPEHFEIADIEGVIFMLLEQWKRSQEGDVTDD